MQGFIPGLSILFYLLVCLSLCQYQHCFDYDSFILSFEMKKCETSNFVLLFKNYFGYSESLEIP